MHDMTTAVIRTVNELLTRGAGTGGTGGQCTPFPHSERWGANMPFAPPPTKSCGLPLPTQKVELFSAFGPKISSAFGRNQIIT